MTDLVFVLIGIGLWIPFMIIGIKYNATLFTTLAGLFSLITEAETISGGPNGLTIWCIAAPCASNLYIASTADYVTFVILLVVLTVTAFYGTIAIRFRQIETNRANGY